MKRLFKSISLPISQKTTLIHRSVVLTKILHKNLLTISMPTDQLFVLQLSREAISS